MEMRFLTERALRMGGRDQEARFEDGICQITQLEVARFDGEQAIFLVKHTSFIEHSLGDTELVAYSESLHDHLLEAQAEFERVHFDPPTTVPEGYS